MSRTFRIVLAVVINVGFFAFFWQPVHAASLVFSAAATNLRVGQTTTVAVIVRSAEQAMNASQGKVSFPTDTLQVTKVSKGSLFAYWTTEPTYSNSNGTISFGGGLPNPGYKGSGRTVITVTFKAKAEGRASISYSSGTILANDGLGTNILTGYGSAVLNISAATPEEPEPSTPEPSPSTATPIVRSSTHPDASAWYSANDLTFTWTRPNGVQGVSYLLDQNAATVPDESLEENSGTRAYNDVVDGTWYFHLRAKYSTGWSSAAHVRVRIDTKPPESFTPEVHAITSTKVPTYQFTFTAADSGSGVIRYLLALDTQEFSSVTSPHTIETQKSGIHQYTVRAIDGAGNIREAVGQFNVEGSPAPRLTNVPKKITLFEDFTVEGLSQQGDTIIFFIDGKENARFSSDAYGATTVPGVAIPSGYTFWRYTYKPLLVPGAHTLTAKAISHQGLESPESVGAAFLTLGGTVQLFGFLVPSAGVVITLLVIIMFLLALLVILYERFRHWQRSESFDLTTAEDQINEEIDRLQSSLEKDIVGAIRSSVSERSLQAATHEQIRKDIVQVRRRIDDLVDREVKKLKRKKKQKR